jgi:amidase
MARSVADVVTLFNAMVGYDQQDISMPLISADMRLSYREIVLADKRLGALESYADNNFYQNAVSLLSENAAVIVDIDFQAERDSRFSEFLGGEMVRDLARYLEEHSSSQVGIDSVISLKEFNNRDLDLRAPYGQALIDMMAEINLSEEGVEGLRAELQGWGRGILDQLFYENNIEVLVGVNQHQASIAALANYPALTIPMGYSENGQPIGLTFITPSFQEQLLIDVGVQFEKLIQARQGPVNYR